MDKVLNSLVGKDVFASDTRKNVEEGTRGTLVYVTKIVGRSIHVVFRGRELELSPEDIILPDNINRAA